MHEFFRTITEEILDYVVQETTDPASGFYSTQEADSEGEEGTSFVWTPDQIREALGNDADEFMAAYGVTRLRRLALFGSTLRGNSTADSDLDVLVEFEPDHVPGLAFFAVEAELSELLGRAVASDAMALPRSRPATLPGKRA